MKYPILLIPSGDPIPTETARRFGQTFYPNGIIPRDLNVVVRAESGGLREVEIPITSCDGTPGAGATVTLGGQTVTADNAGIARFTIAPGRYTLTVSGLGTAGTAEVVVVDDTFTDTDGTDIVDHTGEVGATWEIDDVFGQGEPGNPYPLFKIENNGVRRVTFAEDFNADGGEALIRPSGTLPSGWTRATIEFGLRYRNIYDGFMALYEQAVNPSNNKFMCYVAAPSFGGATCVTTYNGASTVDWPFVSVVDQVHIGRLEIDGANLEVFIDDVSIATFTRPAQPIEPFGIDLFDPDSEGAAVVEYARIFVPAIAGSGCAPFTETITIPAA